ncbi:hypothetical protein D9M71_809800 [compost metagenome]
MTAGLSNATAYLDVFGRVVIGWIWLRQALVASHGLQQGAEGTEATFYQGKLHAAQYFMDWELACIPSIAKLLTDRNHVALDMHNDWF